MVLFQHAAGRLSADKLLLISFDGFRGDYDRDVDMLHLDVMVKDGVKATYVMYHTHFTILTSEDAVIYCLKNIRHALIDVSNAHGRIIPL
uniref:Uncharacterized protein n=1 Tax=Cyprinus carpio TaxID=7962 RepID=A0A8C1S0M7_CYPCA